MEKGNKSRNAFYFFMQDFRNQQGRSFNSLKEVADAANPHWQNLTPHQRRKYEEMAKSNKAIGQKQTSIGEIIDEVQQEQKEKLEREMAMKQDIDNIIKKAVNTKTIADEYFYVMHINTFCNVERENRYFPAEIALGKFNLRDGILKEEVHSSLVQPGPLPLGYSSIAIKKAEETHQIQHMADENNMKEVLMALIGKLSESEMDNYPPIYVSEDNILVVENVLENMCNDYGHNNIFSIYSLQYLLFALKNNLSETNTKVWPTISVSKMQLEKDIYDYCSGIACAYHETAEIPVHCSQSRIIRWVYIVCDNCNGDLDLPLIQGYHIPFNALNSQQIYSKASSIVSSASHLSAACARSVTSSSKQDDLTSDIYSTGDDESVTSAYHGFDSETTIDEETWQRPRRAVKNKSPQRFSRQSDICNQLSQSSTNTDFIPSRRPLTQSSASPGVGLASNPIRGKGRGRGILQTRPPP